MIHLTQNKGFKWYNQAKIYVKGGFTDAHENYLEGSNLPAFFTDVETFSQFVEKLKTANGLFSVVVQHENETWLAVDRNISFPLFYAKQGHDYFITDNYHTLSDADLDASQQAIYSSFGHTYGEATLCAKVKQVQCAEAVCIKKNTLTQQFYHRFSVAEFICEPYAQLKAKALQLFKQSLQRLIKSLNGKTAVVPLSGGYDSRFIASGLKMLGYKKVICFTYGKKQNNQEWILSKRVADGLGYSWYFIEYNEGLFSDFANTKIFQDYVRFMAHGTSMFYLQEYFAVKYLKDNRLIPDNAVFIPGHSGDLIGGSQLVKVFPPDLDIAKLADEFVEKKAIYSNLNKAAKQKLKQKLNAQKLENHLPATQFEALDIREKISKVIFNSSLVFDFFDYEKRFPFWDIDLLRFFLALPPEHRIIKKLYDNLLEEEFFAPQKLHFQSEMQPGLLQLKEQNIKNIIKQLLPIFLRKYFLKKADWKNYYQATRYLVNQMDAAGFAYKFKARSYNEILIQYYLFIISNKKK